MNHQAEYLEEELRKARAEVAVLETELAQKNLLVREMDLMFGRMLLGMRAAVIEEEHGKGADAAMVWIFNGLVGPGELPPEEDTDAQAYFDREVKAIDEGMKQIMDERKALCATPVPAERVDRDGLIGWVRKSDLTPLRDERMPSGKHVSIGVDHPTCWMEDTPYDHLCAIYTTPQPAPTAAQDVAGLVEALEQGFPLFNDDGLDEVEHHCEWAIQQDRKRLHALIAAHQSGGAK